MCGHGERAMSGASILDRGRTRRRRRARRRARGLAHRHRHRSRNRVTTLTDAPAAPVRLGLRENLAQFSLLVAVNALVGGMIGQERIVLPLLAEREFGLTAFTAGLTFIAAFGAVKAVTNFFAGTLSDRYGRKPVLVAGWIIGVPVPLLLIWAPSWGWVIAANVLLGINQGLTWSTTVIMKIDLVGPERRGFAMGFNEAAGYGAVALTALATGYIADNAGLRPEPFYLGIAFAALGPRPVDPVRARDPRPRRPRSPRPRPPGRRQHGGGVPPDELLGQGDVVVQPGRDGEQPQRRPRLGPAADLLRRRRPQRRPDRRARRALPRGLGPRAARHRRPVGSRSAASRSSSAACSPRRRPSAGSPPPPASRRGPSAPSRSARGRRWCTRRSSPRSATSPTRRWRARSVGVYRLWRDGGFAVGALLAGVLADWFSITAAIWAVAALTAVSGLVVLVRMYETHTASVTPNGT